MKKEHLAFLIGGLAFGVLLGFGVDRAIVTQPVLGASTQGPGASGSSPSDPRDGSGGPPVIAEVEALEQRLQEDPEDLGALIRLANIHQDVSMWQQAVNYYERARAIRPDDPNLLTDLGVCYRGLGRYEDALKLFDLAHRVDAGHWQSLFNTVIVAGFDVGQFDRARAALAAMEAMDSPPPQLGELRDALERAAGKADSGSEG